MRQARHDPDPIVRANAEAKLMDQDLPVSGEAMVRRGRALEEMAGDV